MVKLLWSAISLPRSQVKERRSSCGSLRTRLPGGRASACCSDLSRCDLLRRAADVCLWHEGAESRAASSHYRPTCALHNCLVLHLLHEPAVAHHDRLTSQRVRSERSQEQCGLCHVVDGREFTVNSFLEHNVLDNFLLGDAKLLRLFGNLFVDERCAHETRADDVCQHNVRRPLLALHAPPPPCPVLCQFRLDNSWR